MSWINSVRIAFMPSVAAVVCALILLNTIGDVDASFKALTMAFGFLVAAIPSVILFFFPLPKTKRKHYFSVIFLMSTSFALGLIFAASSVWSNFAESKDPSSLEISEILKFYLPGFLFSAMAIEAVRYFVILKKIKKYK